ncbi:MAG: DNA mismatch repair protein MutS [Candidatus Limiplasma sp.]|nr:DNA mismatch repair protein MutS [Candidatus Limiplasma sp.]
MKAQLMYRETDVRAAALPAFIQEMLTRDLELGIVFSAMAKGDEIIRRAAERAFFAGLDSPEAIGYRQSVLRDCIKNPAMVRASYGLTLEALEKQKKGWWWFDKNRPLTALFSNAVDSLTMLTGMLKELRDIADRAAGSFASQGFTALWSMLQRELDDGYFAQVQEHLAEVKFRDGMLISARLGSYNQGVGYVLRRRDRKGFKRKWFFAPSFALASRDEAGAQDFNKRRERALQEAANVLAQSAEHIVGFFTMLRDELAFYVGCLNLHDGLKAIGAPVAFPSPLQRHPRRREVQGLYDISLAIQKQSPATGSGLSARDQSLWVITGANQGGKSTFLRSIGQSQLMMQCGLFVAAREYRGHLCNGVFTHFKREEDAALVSGKLDEELSRMDAIAQRLAPGALVLFNESFSATNEREGSEISRQVTDALIHSGMEVFCVTHLYDFASSYFDRHLPDATFLQAERKEDGRRTFRIVPGRPSQTGFGDDLYQRIFADEPGPQP